jgi:RHS repeat-associated protein
VTTNSVTQTRGANRQNEITSVSGATAPTYDSNGNLTKDENDYRFVWDAWNMMVQVKNSSNVVIVTMGRDALHRHVTDTEGTSLKDRFFSLNWQVLDTKAGSNTVSRNVWSPAYVDAMVLRDRDTDNNGTLDERVYPLQDANWNTTGLMNASGTVVERETYGPYGGVTFRDTYGSVISTSAKDWVFLHQGGEKIAAGDYEFRNRVVSPTLGRWLSNDPLGFEAGDVNTYRTEINSPVNQVDPEGLVLPLIGWGIAAYAVGEGGIFGYGLWLEHEPKMRSDELDEKLRQIHLAHPEYKTNGRVPGADNPNGTSVRNLGDELIPGNEAHRQSTTRDANRLREIGERAYPAAIPSIGIRPGPNSRPPNLSPSNSGRGGAFNQAKRNSGIPTSQQPSRVLPNRDRQGRIQPGRQYEFDVITPGGGKKTIIIREDAGGSYFGEGNPQNRGPHFNDENGGHYDY